MATYALIFSAAIKHKACTFDGTHEQCTSSRSHVIAEHCCNDRASAVSHDMLSLENMLLLCCWVVANEYNKTA
jgi:hypothetical protein